MKAIEFKQHFLVFAKDQKVYLPCRIEKRSLSLSLSFQEKIK